MAEIYNFVEVSQELSTSGIVPAKHFQRLADESFEVVINLLPDASEHAVPEEAEIIQGLGIEYVYIPVDFAAPRPEDFAQFAAAMEGARGRKVWAHCAANYRVSAFVSIYGQRYLGWTTEQAQALVDRLWEPNDVWQAFMKGELERGQPDP